MHFDLITLLVLIMGAIVIIALITGCFEFFNDLTNAFKISIETWVYNKPLSILLFSLSLTLLCCMLAFIGYVLHILAHFPIIS